MAIDALKINDMVFYAFHGLESCEKAQGQRFEVDVELALDLSHAGNSDRIEDTIDVNAVYEIIEEVVLEGDFNLVEAVAEHIAASLLNKVNINEVRVRVRKPHAPLKGLTGGIEVEIQRTA
ncbi:dihydroneopterin aldolase [candidate division KSB1 bacterium]|nr:dihydroneopterin aldolase [candidate division KSB1 bacterium]